MKKSLIIAMVIIATALTADAQRFAYVNTDYILKNIPEYKAAQDQIDKITTEWRAEVDKKQKEIFRMNNIYLPKNRKKPKQLKLKPKKKR